MRRESVVAGLSVAFFLASSVLLLTCSGRTDEEGFVGATAPGKTTSSRRPSGPLYAKVVLAKDGGKTLSVVFHESKGTGKGYDLLHADVNLTGNLDKAKRLKAKTRKRLGTLVCTFPPIKVNIPDGEKPDSPANPCAIHFFSYSAAGTPFFYVKTDRTLRQGSTKWEHSLWGQIEPAESLEKAAVWDVSQTPKLDVATRPDPRRDGCLGIGLTLVNGSIRVGGKAGRKSLEAHIEIRRPNGDVVHKDTNRLDKFTFG